MRPLILRISTAAAFSVVTAGMALAQVLVVPGAQTNVEGNSNNVYPFSTSFASINAMHYQQVYGANEFGSSPIRITGISFRPDAIGGAGNWTIPTADIRFSTTSAAVDGLSLTFANNVGADNTLVRSGSLSISSAFSGPVGGPKVFDIFIPFTTSFVYDPSQGNLLMDVFTAGASSTIFDAQSSSGDAVSRIGTEFGNPNSPTAEFANSIGLVTQFHYEAVEAVPEPGTMALMGLGALAVYRRRKKSK